MPEEFSRTTKRKRIDVGRSYVDVPVITKIAFIDPHERYQEYQFEVNNTSTADRDVRVDRVHALDEDGEPDPDVYLDVERLKVWSFIDPKERHQETHLTFDNETGKDDKPPHFSTHKKTHVVRYQNPDDRTAWIDSELIDSFAVVDPNNRYQETVYTLKNPQGSEDAQADPDDEDITDADPPWRTDPFQNIVNLSRAPIRVFINATTQSHPSFNHFAAQGEFPFPGPDWNPAPQPEPPWTSWACTRCFATIDIGDVPDGMIASWDPNVPLSRQDVDLDKWFSSGLVVPQDHCLIPGTENTRIVSGMTVTAKAFASTVDNKWPWIQSGPIRGGVQAIGGTVLIAEATADLSGLTISDPDSGATWSVKSLEDFVNPAPETLTFWIVFKRDPPEAA